MENNDPDKAATDAGSPQYDQEPVSGHWFDHKRPLDPSIKDPNAKKRWKIKEKKRVDANMASLAQRSSAPTLPPPVKQAKSAETPVQAGPSGTRDGTSSDQPHTAGDAQSDVTMMQAEQLSHMLESGLHVTDHQVDSSGATDRTAEEVAEDEATAASFDHTALPADTRICQTQGELNTNHFGINIAGIANKVVYQYPVTIIKLPNTNMQSNAVQDQNNGRLSARVTRRVILLYLRQIARSHSNIAFASNFKTEVVSSASIYALPAPQPNNKAPTQTGAAQFQQPIVVNYYDEDESMPRTNCSRFSVVLGEEKVVRLGQVIQYLRSRGTTVGQFGSVAAAENAVKEAVNVLNVIISQRANELLERTPTSEPEYTNNSDKKFYLIPRATQFDHTHANNSATVNGLAWDLQKPGSLIALPGYFRSTRALFQSNRPLLLNINTTTGSFYPGGRSTPASLLTVIRSLRDGQYEWQGVEQFIKGLRVKTTYRRSSPKLTQAAQANNETVREFIYTVGGLPYTNRTGSSRYWDQNQPEPTAASVTFETDQGSITVADHFNDASTHGSDVTGNDIVVRIGDSNFQPASKLMVLPGQPYKKTLEPIIYGSRPPLDNWNMITNGGLRLFGIDVHSANLFGVNIDTNNMLKVKYQRLSLPPIVYGSPAANAPNRPSWDLRDRRFLVGSTTEKKWSFIEVHFGQPSGNTEIQKTLRNFGQNHVTKYGSSSGGFEYANYDRIPYQQHRVQYHDQHMVNNLRTFYNLRKQKGIEVLLVLINGTKPGPSAVYNAIKRWGDLEAGIVTICLLKSKPKDGTGPPFYTTNPTQLANLTLKYNLKTDFTAANHGINLAGRSPLLTNHTMLVGIDVTHPAGIYIKPAPSVAAMVASTDVHFNQFPASLRTNPRPDDEVEFRQGQEEIKCLEPMLNERLAAWKQARNVQEFPERITFFRDGISTDQFEMCRQRELLQLQRSIKKNYEANNQELPEILLICAVKRHHCRFYRDSRKGANNDFTSTKDGRDNPATGVTIFTEVTYGQDQDFFLVSQDTIKGTTRPTHYVVLHNGITSKVADDQGQQRDFTIYDIAEMTYQLCWIYGRATKTVGLVPPAYYADRAAFRARAYMEHVYNATFARSVNETYDPLTNASHRLPLALPTHAQLKMLYI